MAIGRVLDDWRSTVEEIVIVSDEKISVFPGVFHEPARIKEDVVKVRHEFVEFVFAELIALDRHALDL